MRNLLLAFWLGVDSASTGVCEGPGAQLDSDDHCFCSGDNIQPGLDGSSCECVLYHLQWEDSCLPCSGPGASIENGECVCDPAFSQKITNDADKTYSQQTCGCIENTIYEYDLSRGEGYHNQECVACSGPGAILDDNRQCVCTGYGEQYTVFDEATGICSCNTESLVYFHESSQRECCVLCHGPGASLAADAATCECLNGSVFKKESTVECHCPAGYQQSSNGCVACSGVGAKLVDGVCNCADNAVLVDGVCSCDQAGGWFHFITEDDCRSCGDFAVLDQTNGECVCTDENASLQSDNSCLCNDGYLKSDLNSCVACSGLGELEAVLSKNGVCTCTVENSELVDNQCQCKTGYLPFGNSCVACAGVLTFLDKNGECSCPDTYVLNSVNQCTLCPSGTLLPGSDDCDFTIFGGRWVNGKIECNPDFHYYDAEGTCIKCTGPGAYLDEDTGLCACQAESLTILSTSDPGLCVCDSDNMALDFGDICKTCTGHGAKLVEVDGVNECQCGTNAALTWQTTGWVCVCNQGFLEGDDGNCYECLANFNPADQTCTCDKNRVLNDAGTDCMCPDGHFMTSDGSDCILCDVASSLVVGFIEDTCICERNAVLDSETGTCSCSKGYKEHNGMCIRCEIDLTEGECLCPAGSMMFNFGENCVSCIGTNAFLVGDQCTCGQFEVLDENSECQCAEGYQLFGSNCIRCAGLGAELDKAGNCVCSVDNTIPTVTALGLECQCDTVSGFLLADDETCVKCLTPGVFDSSSKECACDADIFLTANENGDGCECEKGYSVGSDGSCIKCDTSSEFFLGFFNNVCQCVAGASLNDESTCVCDAGFLSHSGSCVLCDADSGAFLNDQGVCSCPENFLFFNNACIACSGLSSKLSIDGVCECGPHEELISNVCTCKADFMPHSEGYCTSCSGIGAELINDVCTCTNELYTLQLVDNKATCACKDGLKPADDGNCYLCTRGIFDPLDASCTCDETENFFINKAGDTCECGDLYLLNEESECVKCDTTSPVFEAFVNGVCQCKAGAVLTDGVCGCGTSFILNQDSGECVSCKQDSGAFLNDSGECSCPAGHMLFFGECIACSGPGAVLNSNGVCQCADFASLVTDPNDPSAVEACQCNANFLPFNDVCVMCSGIGAVLSEAGVCTCGEGAQLNIVDDLLQCVCPATWTESNDKCFQCDNGKLVDDLCTCDADLNLVLNAAGNGCECDSASFFLTKTSGECLQCDTSNALISMFFDDECVCVDNAVYADGSCTCSKGFIAHESECVKCDVDNGSIFTNGVCSCGEGFLLHDGSCVACTGLSADLVNGVCECGPNEKLENGVCVCVDDEYITTPSNTCVRCYGIGSMLDESEHCTCNGVEGTQFDPVLVGKCICQPPRFTFGLEKCVQCSGVGFKYNEETGECQDAEGLLVEKSVTEIRAELNTFQLCLMDFFTANLQLNTDLQKQILIKLYTIDFSSLQVGGLKDFLLSADIKAQFEAISFMDQLNLLILEDSFFSVTQLFNVLVVFVSEGVDIDEAAFVADLKAIANADFFLQTSETFTFEQFGAVFATAGVTIDALLVQLRLSGALFCVGPGATLNEDEDGCDCSNPLTTFDKTTFSCACNADNGLEYDSATDSCVCKDSTFSTLVGDVCVFISLEETQAQLNAYQMCVGNFITQSFEVTDIDAVYRLVFSLDFSGFAIGGFEALLQTISVELGALVDVNAVFSQLFGIEMVINLISVMEVEGVDITAESFLTDLDFAVLSVADFWSLTATSFSFDIFGNLFTSLNIDLATTLAGFEASGAYVACFGPGALVVDDSCTCTIEHTVLDKTTAECGCITSLKFDESQKGCICSEEYTNLQKDGTCLAWTADEWIVELDAYQMCLASFVTNEVTIDQADLPGFYKQIALTLDFTTFDLSAGLDLSFFPAGFIDFFQSISINFEEITAQANFFSFQQLVNIINIMASAGVDITSVQFMADIKAAVTVDFWALTIETFKFDLLGDFFASYSIEVSLITEKLSEVGFVLCTGGVVESGKCTCGEGLLFDNLYSCLSCSGPTASVSEQGKCSCDNIDYQLLGDVCTACPGATASFVGDVCTCNDSNSLLNSQNICVSCFGETATLDADVCKCGDQHQLASTGECIKCFGEGASLTADDACTCNDLNYQLFNGECKLCNSDTATLDDSGECACNDKNSLINSLNVCVSCFGDTASLVNDLCECGDNHIIYNNEQCVACSGETAELNADGQCVCDEGNHQFYEGRCIPCEAATAKLKNGQCTCIDANAELSETACTCNKGFLTFNSQCVACSGETAALDDNGECVCGVSYVLENNACREKTVDEWKLDMTVFQLCFMSFIESQVTLGENLLGLVQYIAINLDFSTVSIGAVSSLFTAEVTTQLNNFGLDFEAVLLQANFFSFERLVDLLLVMKNQQVDINSADFIKNLEAAFDSKFWALTEATFKFDLLEDFITSYNIQISAIVNAWAQFFVLCTGGTVVSGVCECSDSILYMNYVCIPCSGPTASLVDDSCQCGTGAAGVGTIELIDNVCTCPANSIISGETCALDKNAGSLLIHTLFAGVDNLSDIQTAIIANYGTDNSEYGRIVDMNKLSNSGEQTLSFFYNFLITTVGAEAAFAITKEDSFSIFVFIIDFLNELSLALPDFSIAYATDVAGLVTFLTGFSKIEEVTFEQYAKVLSSMASLFTIDISTGIEVIGTEAFFLNAQASSTVNIGKFCGGFVDAASFGVTSYECVCQESFVAVVEDNGFVNCQCPDSQTQVDGSCVAEAVVTAVTKSVDISASIVTAYTYSNELANSSSLLFQAGEMQLFVVNYCSNTSNLILF